MRVRRRSAALLTLLALSASGATDTGTPSRVLVLGDSYASGLGLPEATGECGTESSASWGALVAEGLGAELDLQACAGAEVADVLTGGGDLGRPAQVGAPPADLVLLMVGGNDLGFIEIVGDCLGFADVQGGAATFGEQATPWTDLVAAGRVDTGCDTPTSDLLARVDELAGVLEETYVTVAGTVVADGGRLVVVGYPGIVADPELWPARYGERCHAVRAGDAGGLVSLVESLDAAVADAVGAADERLGGGVVTHVPVLGPSQGADGEGDHRLCGGGEPWLNGLTVAEGGVNVVELLTQLGGGPGGVDLEAIGARPGGSFHPGTAGHRGIAATVLDALGGAGS